MDVHYEFQPIFIPIKGRMENFLIYLHTSHVSLLKVSQPETTLNEHV